jgi:large subunit ribosomal protein L3
MSIGLVGSKVGMTRVFSDDGSSIPVTVINVANNRITQIKTVVADGYSSIQLAFGDRRASRVRKSQIGHLAKAGVKAGSVYREFRTESPLPDELQLGATVGAQVFSVGQMVDVSGTSIGKGFAGAIKRHNFSSNRASHGNSVSHNAPGSIGMAQDPGRVFPGKRMAGHLGDRTCTTQNLEVVRVDVERQLLLVKGAVPGAKGGHLLVTPAVKSSKRAE